MHIKRCIEGKEITIATRGERQIKEIEKLIVTFGNNQIIGIDFSGMTETVEVKDYKDDVLVNSPEKAYKLLSNFMAAAYGIEKNTMDKVCVSYVEDIPDNEIIPLRPVVEFYEKEQQYMGNVIQVNVLTKEVRSAKWTSLTVIEK